MSMELYAFSDRQIGSIEEWQKAINAEGFVLKLDASRPFEALSGHLPAEWDGKHAGFECDHFDAAEVMDDQPEFDYGRRWKFLLAFRWGADFRACMGAYMAAAAYARATGGMVFDCEEGKMITPDEAAEVARATERDLPKLEAL